MPNAPSPVSTAPPQPGTLGAVAIEQPVAVPGPELLANPPVGRPHPSESAASNPYHASRSSVASTLVAVESRDVALQRRIPGPGLDLAANGFRFSSNLAAGAQRT